MALNLVIAALFGVLRCLKKPNPETDFKTQHQQQNKYSSLVLRAEEQRRMVVRDQPHPPPPIHTCISGFRSPLIFRENSEADDCFQVPSIKVLISFNSKNIKESRFVAII